MTDTPLLVPGWPAPVRRPVPVPAEAARRAGQLDAAVERAERDAVTGHGVGIARYVAHVAVTVTNEWRHRGVGRALAERLLVALGERLWTLRGDGTVRIAVRLTQACISPRSSA